MQTQYTVFERDSAGALMRITEIRGAVQQNGQRWEMHTRDRVIPGTLDGHPLAAHVFTDADGLEYRVT